MDLSKYQNKELKGAIESMKIYKGKAKESGNDYYAVDIEFINGYKKRLFLNNEESFAFCNAFDTLDISKQLNIDEI